MAKRFTDSEKWRKPWFRSLSAQARITWIYLTDNCDHAGLWPASFDLASMDLGFTLNDELLKSWFGEKILCLGDKYFIPGFIEFQYGSLRIESKPHGGVIRSLEKHGINSKTLRVCEEYPKGIGTLKDKNKNKDKDKEIPRARTSDAKRFEMRFDEKHQKRLQEISGLYANLTGQVMMPGNLALAEKWLLQESLSDEHFAKVLDQIAEDGIRWMEEKKPVQYVRAAFLKTLGVIQ